jgi:molybdate/tungstate transport system substrate-binding protein
VGDVFISASPAVNSSLEGTANGNWVSSYDEFGTSALVLGYNQNSKFAKDLEKLPWFDVVDRAGFRLGRTNPSIDSKGVLSVDALTGVALSYGVPDLGTLAVSSSNIFSGASLVSELQAGQLDAGFFYGVEASTAHIKTVPLVGTHLVVQYTVAMLNRAPHESGAKAFVRFLLGPVGRQILKANGVNTINPAKVVTATTSVTTNTTIPITTNTTTTNTGPPTTDTTVP